METAFYLENTGLFPLLGKKVWGIQLVKRVWLSWQKKGLEKLTLIINKKNEEQIKNLVKDIPCEIVFFDNTESDQIKKTFDFVFPINAVYPFNGINIKTLSKWNNNAAFSNHYILINNEKDIAAAETVLAEAVRKKAPTWVAREINKRISLKLSRRLSDIGLNPNLITSFCLLLAVLSGYFASLGTHFGTFLAVFFLQFNSILDGCDGEVARLTFKKSKFGAVFDIAVDYIALAIFTIGSIIGAQNYASPAYIAFGNTIIVLSLLALLIIGILCRNSPAKKLISDDAESEIWQQIKNYKGTQIQNLIFRIFFFFSRRDGYILSFFIVGAFFWRALYPFIVFVYAALPIATYLSILRTEKICQNHT